MADVPIPISDISDPDQIRVMLLASGKSIHAPMGAFSAASVHAAPTKTTPIDADEFGFWDSVGLQAVKTTWANIKATLETYFDTLYVALTGAQTVAGVKTFSSIPVLSGGAISFPATQVPSAGANDLDDYEEGTFTPAFSASGSTFNHNVQTGLYTKVGRIVFVDITLSLQTTGNTLTANALTITGLPFSAAGGVGPFWALWNNATTSYVAVTGDFSGTVVTLRGNTAAANNNVTAILANGLLHATNAPTFRLKGFYTV